MAPSRIVPRFLSVLLVLVLARPAHAGDPTPPHRNEPRNTSTEGIVIASVGGMGMGIGLGVMVAGALSNLSFQWGGTGCEQERSADGVSACRQRHDAERARDRARAETRVRNGAIVTAAGAVVLALGVAVIVASQKPDLRREPPRAGVRLFPVLTTMEQSPRVTSDTLALEVPLVGGRF